MSCHVASNVINGCKIACEWYVRIRFVRITSTVRVKGIMQMPHFSQYLFKTSPGPLTEFVCLSSIADHTPWILLPQRVNSDYSEQQFIEKENKSEIKKHCCVVKDILYLCCVGATNCACASNKMWIKIVEKYLVVITVWFTLSHCSFTVKRTESMYLDLNDSNTLMLANAHLVNATHHTNRTIVKRAAPNAHGPPLAVIPPDLSHGPETAETIELYMFKYPIIKAAHIGTQTFS